MGIARKYLKSIENAAASYDYNDLASGEGLILFNGYNTLVPDYFLSESGLASDTIETVYTTDTAKDWITTPFNLPRIVRGKATLRFSAGMTVPGTISIHFDVSLRKVTSTGVETDIGGGTISTSNLSRSGAGSVAKNYNMVFTVAQTGFKRGDYIKLKITPSGAASTTATYIANDPLNRAGTVITPTSSYPTTMELLIPFKIDL